MIQLAKNSSPDKCR